MLQWMFGYGLVFLLVYLLYTRKVQVPRFTFAGYWATGFLFAMLCGIASHTMAESWAYSPPRAVVAMLISLILAGVELLFCLQLSEKIFGRYQHMLRLVELYHKGLLVEMPFRQGEKLYWIDFNAAIPCVRSMYFVVVVSGCYIGIFEDGRRLVSVRQVFTDKQAAKQMLTTFEWNLYAHRS